MVSCWWFWLLKTIYEQNCWHNSPEIPIENQLCVVHYWEPTMLITCPWCCWTLFWTFITIIIEGCQSRKFWAEKGWQRVKPAILISYCCSWSCCCRLFLQVIVAVWPFASHVFCCGCVFKNSYKCLMGLDPSVLDSLTPTLRGQRPLMTITSTLSITITTTGGVPIAMTLHHQPPQRCTTSPLSDRAPPPTTGFPTSSPISLAITAKLFSLGPGLTVWKREQLGAVTNVGALGSWPWNSETNFTSVQYIETYLFKQISGTYCAGYVILQLVRH